MGADFVTEIFAVNTERKLREAFGRQVDSDRDENGHRDGYSGDFQCFEGMEIRSRIFDSYQEAENYIEKYSEKWGAAIAVQYKDSTCDRDKVNKGMKPIKEKITKTREDLGKFEEALVNYVKDRLSKVKFIRCSNCKSSLNTEYYEGTSYRSCMVCKETFATKTMIAKRQRLNDKLDLLISQAKEKQAKLIKRHTKIGKKTQWLVGGWVAC